MSAHYLVGKDGTVTEMLNPKEFWAAHAGDVRDVKYSNRQSIGIECHYSIGDDKTLPYLYSALTELVRLLMATYSIDLENVVTHRWAAIPKGRKQDPSFWSDAEFLEWRSTLVTDNHTILNGPSVSVDRLQLILDTRKIPNSALIASAFTTFGELTTIGNVIPFAQAVHETAWFTSPRWVQSNNPAGIGATSDSVWGNTFNGISAGVFAQYAHLLCYALDPVSGDPILQQFAELSPRRTALAGSHGLGSAPTWAELGAKWAKSPDYGNRVLTIAKQIFGDIW